MVAVREPGVDPSVTGLAARCLAFVEDAQLPEGRFRNRRAEGGAWLDEGGPDDSTARALLALAVAARADTAGATRERALWRFSRASGFSSRWSRPSAQAAIAAIEILELDQGNRSAERVLTNALPALGRVGRGSWPWPEPRLTWGNALLPHALIAAGVSLDMDGLLACGLRLLGWLVDVESVDEHFSFTPVGGWRHGEPRPGFDQQPIEAGVMAEACALAYDVTGDRAWRQRTLRAAAWFLGSNDGGIPLLDGVSGGCCDGLHAHGRNANQGAESTIAMISALQQARRVGDQRTPGSPRRELGEPALSRGQAGGSPRSLRFAP